MMATSLTFRLPKGIQMKDGFCNDVCYGVYGLCRES